MFTVYVSDKGLECRIYKNSYMSVTKNANNSIKKGQKVRMDTSKIDTQIVNLYTKRRSESLVIEKMQMKPMISFHTHQND